MKKAILTSVLIWISLMMNAQEWTLRTPVKSISDISEMTITADNTILALDTATNIESLLISNDGGVTYRRIYIDAEDIQMLTNDTGFLVSSRKLYKTTDQFETIEELDLGTSGIISLFFLDENTGYVSGGSGRMLKTTDGGQNWESQSTGTTEILRDHYFINANLGFACGDDRTFIKTEDGGQTWTEITLNISENWDLEQILFIDNNNGVLIAGGGISFYTNDAGTTWTEATTDFNFTLNDVKYINNKLIGVGNSGLIATSTDMGVNWTSNDLGNDYYLSLAGNSGKIYVGGEGDFFESSDEGASLEIHQQGYALSTLGEISFANDDVGLIVGRGNNGSATFVDLMYRTEDAGLTWDREFVFGGYNAIHFLSNGKALTTTSNINRVAISEDFGLNWDDITGPNITQQFIAKAVWLKSENDFFVGGGNFFDSDGLYRYQTGQGWSHDPSLGNVTRIKFLNDNFGLVARSNNQLYKTTDGGTTWEEINYAGGTFRSINFIDENTFYIGQYVYASRFVRGPIRGNIIAPIRRAPEQGQDHEQYMALTCRDKERAYS